MDTQPAPQPEGSVREAQQAIIGLLDSQEKQKAEEAEPQEEAVSEEEPEEEAEESVEDDEEESEEETEEGEEDEEEVEELYTLRVDGEELEVTLDELLKGYSRQSSFTRKTQELAEHRKQIEAVAERYQAEVQQIQQERSEYEATLQNLIENSNLDKFTNVDWESLKDTDPLEYTVKRQEQAEAREKIRDLQEKQKEAQVKQSADNARMFEQYKSENARYLVEAIPDFKDQQKQPQLISDLRTYGLSQGFTEDELNGLVDWRSIKALHDAMQWNNLQNADLKTKKIKNKPRVVRSGKGKTKGEDEKKKRASQMKRLKQTGHVRDAAALFEDFVEL